MKKFAKGKLAAVLFAIALTLAVSAAAFAAWPRFQNDYTNTGQIIVPSGGTPPPISAPATTAVQLSNTAGDAWTVVDSVSVINNSTVYTVYNAGTPSAATGGARLQATAISSGTAAWDVELFDASASSPADVHGNDDSQLSTPLILGSNLYAAKTASTKIYDAQNLSGWTGTGGATITAGAA